MNSHKRIHRDSRGASLVEFAFVLPILVAFIFAIAQLGIFYFAKSGLSSAVGEGARMATIYPRPTDEQIIQRITSRRFGLDPAFVTGPTLTHGVVNGRNYVDIEMTYQAPVDLLFAPGPKVTLTERRRAYEHPL